MKFITEANTKNEQKVIAKGLWYLLSNTVCHRDWIFGLLAMAVLLSTILLTQKKQTARIVPNKTKKGRQPRKEDRTAELNLPRKPPVIVAAI